MQEIEKFNLKKSVTPTWLEIYMSFSINNKLNFIDSFQFLSSFLDSLVKNLNKGGLKYLIQEFDKNKLDLVKIKGFYSYEYMTYFEKFKEKLPRKEKFFSSLTGKKNNDKEYDQVLHVRNKLEIKTRKVYHDLYLKCDVLLIEKK